METVDDGLKNYLVQIPYGHISLKVPNADFNAFDISALIGQNLMSKSIS